MEMKRLLRLSWLFPLLVLLLGSCTSAGARLQAKPSRSLLSVGEWQSFVGHELTFYKDGLVVYTRGNSKELLSRLTRKELNRLEGFLRSPEFTASLKKLRSNGYVPGCCDLHEVTFAVEGESFGYPVCEEKDIPEHLARFVTALNELGGNHFTHFRKHPFPKTTCR
jgi:hypothetical protein